MKWVNHETILFASILKQLAQCVNDIVQICKILNSCFREKDNEQQKMVPRCSLINNNE
jgi:hypothetical protein